MAELRVDLQAGFAGDRVEILLDGRVVASLSDVTTDYSVGLAASAQVADPAPGAHDLEIRVPDRGLVGRTMVHIDGPRHVAVAAADGGLDITVATSPFRYL